MISVTPDGDDEVILKCLMPDVMTSVDCSGEDVMMLPGGLQQILLSHKLFNEDLNKRPRIILINSREKLKLRPEN